MIAWIARRPVIAALAGVAVLLAVMIGLEAGFGTRFTQTAAREPSRAAAPPEAKLLPPVVAQAPEQAFPEMTARPLFTPTRRLAPAEPNAGKPAFARGQYVLQGVIVVGNQRTALLREKTSGRVHRVDRGNDVNGVTVESIEPTEVTLAMGGEREKVALVVQRPEGPARSAGPATSSEAPLGPFGAQAPPASAAAPAAAVAAGQPPTGAEAPGTAASPIARGTPRAAAPAVPGATPPTTQPMSPEELLARRRARRNQPTQ